MNTIILDYEREKIINNKYRPMYILRYKKTKKHLKINFNCLNDDIILVYKIKLNSIYNFIKYNKKHKTSLGIEILYDNYINSFKDINNLNLEQLITIIDLFKPIKKIDYSII